MALRRQQIPARPFLTDHLVDFRDTRLWNVLIISAAVLLFIGYLVMNNASATKGFTIKSIERQIITLEEEQKKRGLEVLERQSMENIENAVLDLGFVPVSSVEYLGPGAGVMALK